MEGVGWFGAIIVGGLAGWIAERVTSSDVGIIANVVLGMAGALFLNAALRLVVIAPPGGWIGQLAVGAVGAIILIWAYRTIRGGRRA